MAEEKHYGITPEGNLVEVRDPGTSGHQMDVMHAIVTVDEEGGESIMGVKTASGWMPLVAESLDVIEKMVPIAQQMVDVTGGKVSMHVVEYSQRRVLSRYP